MYLITYKNLTVSAKMKCFSKKVFYIFCTTLSLLSGTTMHIQCIYYVYVYASIPSFISQTGIIVDISMDKIYLVYLRSC